MTMTIRGSRLFCVLFLAGSLPVAAPAAAQLPGTESARGWPPIEVGVRAGYDSGVRDEFVGALLRIPVLPNGGVELVPSMDVTFLRGLREYQYNAEVVYLTAPSEGGGLYAGGGIGFRNTILPSSPTAGRQTVTTWNLVLGAKFAMTDRLNPMIEFRRAFVSELAADPQQLSIGATIELW